MQRATQVPRKTNISFHDEVRSLHQPEMEIFSDFSFLVCLRSSSTFQISQVVVILCGS